MDTVDTSELVREVVTLLRDNHSFFSHIALSRLVMAAQERKRQDEEKVARGLPVLGNRTA